MMTAPEASPAATQSASDDGTAPSEPPIERLHVDIIEHAGDWAAVGAIDTVVSPVVAAIARHPALSRHLPAEAYVVLGNDALLRELNARFRKLDKPTNVLSFPAATGQGFAAPSDRRCLGDVVLALETVLREAAEQTIAPADHVRHLVVHGLLHLMDYDHETEPDAQVMESLEIELLARAGVANPYSGDSLTASQVRS